MQREGKECLLSRGTRWQWRGRGGFHGWVSECMHIRQREVRDSRRVDGEGGGDTGREGGDGTGVQKGLVVVVVVVRMMARIVIVVRIMARMMVRIVRVIVVVVMVMVIPLDFSHFLRRRGDDVHSTPTMDRRLG